MKSNQKQNNQQTDAANNWDVKNQKLGSLAPGLPIQKFEASLQANYFVTFSLYQKLNPVAKNMVYQSYLKKPNIESVTKTISDLSR